MKQTDNITRELNEIQRMFAQFGVKHKTILKTAKTVGAGKGGAGKRGAGKRGTGKKVTFA
jgi:hypothetical protein